MSLFVGNPTLVGPRTPTPPPVYEPRIWKGRIWLKNGPFAGIPFVFKAPYGVGVNAATVLARATARWQITRYQYGPVPASQLSRMTKDDRAALERYETVFDRLAVAWHIDWSA